MGKRQAFDPWNLDARYTYSTAVKKGNLLLVSGITAADPATGEIVGRGDIVAQTRFIYQKLERVLKAAGATFDDVVKTVDYITTTKNYKETGEIRREYFRNTFPVATGVIVNGLLRKDALIEIDVIAVLDSEK